MIWSVKQFFYFTQVRWNFIIREKSLFLKMNCLILISKFEIEYISSKSLGMVRRFYFFIFFFTFFDQYWKSRLNPWIFYTDLSSGRISNWEKLLNSWLRIEMSCGKIAIEYIIYIGKVRTQKFFNKAIMKEIYEPMREGDLEFIEIVFRRI